MGAHTKRTGMSGEHQAFADWLQEMAGLADYDLKKRGAVSKLARDTGNDPAQMSRFLRGQAIPAIEGQRGIAKALGLKLPDVMIVTGLAEPDDFYAAPVHSVRCACDDVPESHRRQFNEVVKLLIALTNGPKARDSLTAIGSMASSLAAITSADRPAD